LLHFDFLSPRGVYRSKNVN